MNRRLVLVNKCGRGQVLQPTETKAQGFGLARGWRHCRDARHQTTSCQTSKAGTILNARPEIFIDTMDFVRQTRKIGHASLCLVQEVSDGQGCMQINQGFGGLERCSRYYSSRLVRARASTRTGCRCVTMRALASIPSIICQHQPPRRDFWTCWV